MAFLNRSYFQLAARLLPALAAMFLLTGCFTDFEPDIASTPVLCMNSNIVAGDSIRVELTRTWRWDEGNPGVDTDITVTDAVVTMSVNNGELTETLELRNMTGDYSPVGPTYKARQQYASDYIPREGDVISFSAHSSEYGDATAGVRVPFATPIDRVDYEVVNFKSELSPGQLVYEFGLHIKTWLTDPADATDYYRFDMSAIGSHYRYPDWDESTMSEFWMSGFFINFDREPLFTEHVSTLESAISQTSGYTIFSDRQISGVSYPLKVDVEYARYILDTKAGDGQLRGYIELELSSLSPSYYNHVLSVWVANDGIIGSLGGVGLGNPVFESSNVSTGAGVVAASARSIVHLQFADIIAKGLGMPE